MYTSLRRIPTTTRTPITRRAVIYARVSTGEQSIRNQVRELRALAQRHSWDVGQVFTDEGISGAHGRDKRPGLDALLKGVVARDFDIVLAWSIDRLGRSLRDLLSLLDELREKRVDLYLHQQKLDTSTLSGKALFQMLGVFAEFERGMIRERVKAGIERARADGTTLGRPRSPLATEARIRRELGKGLGIRRVARALKCGTGTVQRVAKSR